MTNFKLVLFPIYLLLSQTDLFSQQVDYNKIIIPSSISVDDFSEKLVQLAWKNHPANQSLLVDKEIAEINLTQARWSWLSQITASGNLNEYTISPDPEVNVFFPRYNFGVLIPLGIFVSIPTEKKIVAENIEKSQLSINEQKLEIRRQVLIAYQNYLMQEQLFKLANDAVEDEYASFLVVEEKFSQGEASLDDYKAASKTYRAELERKIIVNNELEKAILEIEALIGLKLEEIL